jgi:putative restriction endonuclease
LTEDQLLEHLRDIKVHEHGGKRAPYKPLLLLLSLARLEHGSGGRWLHFRDIEQPLRELMAEFGPPRLNPKISPNYPFWYLKTAAALWEVKDTDFKFRRGKPEPSAKELRDKDAQAGFTTEAHQLLRQDPKLRDRAIRLLVETNFPETLRQDVLDAVGLSIDEQQSATPRDAAFREKVLEAYHFRCAVCGYDGRLGRQPMAIEAAHIRWVQFGGPNQVGNGLCLCSLHHKLFDVGAYTVSPEGYRVAFSNALNGASSVVDQLLAAHNRPLAILPRENHSKPQRKYLEWHGSEVFRSPEIQLDSQVKTESRGS